MGTYDTVEYKCPACNGWNSVQTKLFHCDMGFLPVGCKLPCPINREWGQNFALILKEPCSKCNLPVAMIVESGVVTRFSLLDAPMPEFEYWLIYEKAFGEYGCQHIDNTGFTSKW